MIKTFVNLMGINLPVYETEGATCTSIYEYAPTNEASRVGTGASLKEACMDWLEQTGDISGIIENMEYTALCDGKELKLEIENAGAAFDEFVSGLSGEELFAMMAHGYAHAFVDWSKVK